MNPLNLLLTAPLFAIFYLLLFCRRIDTSVLRSVGIVLSGGIFGLSVYILRQFTLYAKTYYTKTSIGMFDYSIEINGVSILFLVLTSLLTLICVASSRYSITTRVREYLINFFFLEFAIFGVFLARDIIMFYIFFELTLVPMFFIIGVWGGKNRIYSTFKLFLYTFSGSVLFLIAVIFLVTKYNTTSILQLVYNLSPQTGTPLPFHTEKLLWILCFVAFAIKIPMIPFHTWLPNAHVEAPTSGSVILAGILIKLGGYAMIAILLPLFPNASKYFQDLVIILSIIAIIYASIVAFGQEDIKKMIAYSSIAHMGYVTIALFTFTQNGHSAAIFQMISHGIVSGALFLCIGVLYERLHTREFKNFGGITQKMPIFALMFMVFTMSSVGLPGTSGFVGEIIAIFAVFQISTAYGILTASGMVLGASYMLIMYKKTMFGEIKNPSIEMVQDLSKTEMFCLGVLCLLTVFLGIYPKAVLNIIPLFNLSAFL